MKPDSYCTAPTQVDDTSLGCIVRGLQLWNVDNVPTHASSSNETTVGIILELLAMHAGAFHFLTPPVCTGSLGAVVGAIKVGGNDLAVMVNFPVQHSSLCPWDTSVGDEDVETAIELFDNLINRFLDMFGISHIDLVRLA